MLVSFFIFILFEKRGIPKTFRFINNSNGFSDTEISVLSTFVDRTELSNSNLTTNLIRGDNGSIRGERIMNPRIRHEVRLELIEVHIECSVEAERCRDGRDDLGNQPVQIRVGRSRYIQVRTTQVVNGLVVDKESTVAMLQRCVGVEDRIIRFHDGRGNLNGNQIRIYSGRIVQYCSSLGKDGQSNLAQFTESGSSSTLRSLGKKMSWIFGKLDPEHVKLFRPNYAAVCSP